MEEGASVWANERCDAYPGNVGICWYGSALKGQGRVFASGGRRRVYLDIARIGGDGKEGGGVDLRLGWPAKSVDVKRTAVV